MTHLDHADTGRIIRSDPADWRPSVQTKLLGALGSARLGAVLLEISTDMFGASEVFGFRVCGDEVPETIVSYGRRGSAPQRASLYLSRFRHLDPLHAIMRHHALEDRVTVASLGPDDIEDRAYRQQCFDHPGLVEKLSCFQRGGQSIYVLTFYRGAGECLTKYEGLLELAQLALPVLRRHRELLAEDTGLSLTERLQRRLVSRFPLLTAREREVCARTLAGMTAEAIALDLGIGRTSVLTYRRRAYERYGISAAGQLIGDVLS